MEFVVNRGCPVQSDIVWQACIATNHPCLATARYRRVEMNNLAESVDTGVGSPGALHSNRRSSDCGKTLLQHILDSDHTFQGLRLPSIEPAAVVLYPAGQTSPDGQRVIREYTNRQCD